MSSVRLIFDIFGQTLRTLWAHKLRSFLTMFGIAWGVGSLLLLVGLGEGFRAGTAKSMASFGEDFMQIYNGRVPAVGGSQLSSDRKSTRLNSSHSGESRMPSSA